MCYSLVSTYLSSPAGDENTIIGFWLMTILTFLAAAMIKKTISSSMGGAKPTKKNIIRDFSSSPGPPSLDPPPPARPPAENSGLIPFQFTLHILWVSCSAKFDVDGE